MVIIVYEFLQNFFDYVQIIFLSMKIFEYWYIVLFLYYYLINAILTKIFIAI